MNKVLALCATSLLLLFSVLMTSCQPKTPSRIAFVSNRDGLLNYEIYIMDTDGSNQTNLTNNPSADMYPAWSPDDSKIAFESNRNGKWDIFVMDADGSNQVCLTGDEPWDCNSPAWSPDGTKIAFIGYHNIYVMNADGSNKDWLTNGIEV